MFYLTSIKDWYRSRYEKPCGFIPRDTYCNVFDDTDGTLEECDFEELLDAIGQGKVEVIGITDDISDVIISVRNRTNILDPDVLQELALEEVIYLGNWSGKDLYFNAHLVINMFLYHLEAIISGYDFYDTDSKPRIEQIIDDVKEFSGSKSLREQAKECYIELDGGQFLQCLL